MKARYKNQFVIRHKGRHSSAGRTQRAEAPASSFSSPAGDERGVCTRREVLTGIGALHTGLTGHCTPHTWRGPWESASGRWSSTSSVPKHMERTRLVMTWLGCSWLPSSELTPAPQCPRDTKQPQPRRAEVHQSCLLTGMRRTDGNGGCSKCSLPQTNSKDTGKGPIRSHGEHRNTL